MAETIKFTADKEMRLLYASIAEKSAAKLDNGTLGEAKFGATFGIEHEPDFKAIVDIMVNACKVELGEFTSPKDYNLACTSGITAGKRAIQMAELKCHNKPEDIKFKIMEAANKRAELYKPFAGILVANSKFDVEMAYLSGGKVIDVDMENPAAKAAAGKTYFYRGAYVVPAVSFKAYRRKTIEAKDGVTAFLQNVMYLRRGEKLGGSGGAPNSEVFGKFAGYSDYDPMAMAPDGAATGDDDPF